METEFTITNELRSNIAALVEQLNKFVQTSDQQQKIDVLCELIEIADDSSSALHRLEKTIPDAEWTKHSNDWAKNNGYAANEAEQNELRQQLNAGNPFK